MKRLMPFILGIMIMGPANLYAQTTTGLVPAPLNVNYTSGQFILADNIEIKTEKNTPEWQAVTQWLQDGLALYAGICKNNIHSENIINLTTKNADRSLGDEGYTLTVTPERVDISATNTKGLFYGVVTLLQLIPKDADKDGNHVIPCVTIKDKPRFQWRGMHLDVCRHFFPAEFIKRYIDLLAMHKMNTFHWHLTEDQGWRIEIKSYPKLTEIGAWRVDRENEPWGERSDPKPGEKATYGGFYTQEEVKEIVQYAADRQITVVPEIEMPGHAVAALAAYPELSCVEGPFFVIPGGYWPPENLYCAGKEETFEFLQNVLDEVIELFPSPYIHVGGDEAFKDNWEKCPDCQARIKTEGLKNVEELQSYFIKRMEKYLNSKNKRLIGWDEILEGGLAPQAAVMSWRGTEGGIKAASEGHDVVMTPTDYCYFDYYQSTENEPTAIGGYLPLEKVYSYEPMPAELDVDKQHHILGVQGNVWTEYIPNGKHVEYMALPRMCAMAELGWSTPKNRDWDSFQERMASQYDRLDREGVNYRQPAIQGYENDNLFMDSTIVTMTFPRPNANIHYTLDGSEPGPHSPVYTHPLTIDGYANLRAAAYIGMRKVSKVKNGVFTRQSPIGPVVVDDQQPGLTYKFYNGAVTSVNELLERQPDRTGNSDMLTLPNELPEENFGIIFEGLLKIEQTGVYRFSLSSDDGSIIWLHESEFINNDGQHGAEFKTAQVALKAGLHPIKLAFFQGSGGMSLDFQYKGPDITKQPVPASVWFH